MATIPQTHRAVVVVEKGKITVKEKALPTLHDGTVLIKVIAVSVNPTDYKVSRDFHELACP
jgi:NADPH:quinone reductase-like Zn-dependent oxidoreductase